ncbi:hypothetical protein DIC66_22405 [Rhodoferax lacus]|uniref:ABC-2 type transporter transmembrane domain-containing protein n=1 Tax=Rhodoferax lacus TaxID=2184758 RepID=A0A3E1R6H1_9BURK|nr:ABC transporter permease [Rhodoferax lacus]RFO94662.1 hypothetical protein DIC66_22405 [Rhodoferax lacus]
MLGRIYHLLVKEFLQLRRDRSALLRLLIPPLIQMLLFGYAATFEVFNVAIVVLDQDRTQESRALVDSLLHSSRFKLVHSTTNRSQVQDSVETSSAQVGIVVPPGFASLLRAGWASPVQVLLDGTNSNTALIALGYVNQICSSFGQGYALDLAQRTGRTLGKPLVCWRRLNLDHLCRSNFDQGLLLTA